MGTIIGGACRTWGYGPAMPGHDEYRQQLLRPSCRRLVATGLFQMFRSFFSWLYLIWFDFNLIWFDLIWLCCDFDLILFWFDFIWCWFDLVWFSFDLIWFVVSLSLYLSPSSSPHPISVYRSLYFSPICLCWEKFTYKYNSICFVCGSLPLPHLPWLRGVSWGI